MTIPVIWLSKDGVCSKCRMDEWPVQDMLENKQKKPAVMPRFEHHEDSFGVDSDGWVVVVLPGGNHVDDVDWVNHELFFYESVILFITSDEGARFPVEKLDHPNLRLWIQTPRPEVAYPVGTQFFGVGSGRAWQHAHTRDKACRAVLAGQNTHQRRKDAFAATSRISDSVVQATTGFMKGMHRADYLDLLGRAWWAPAPSGVLTQDSFRFYEALELGTIPIPDGLRPDGAGEGYWDMVTPGFPLVAPIKEWRTLPSLLDATEQVLPAAEIELQTHEWWHHRRREMARTLAGQLGVKPSHPMTVVIPTSPIASHPSTAIIDETIRSIRERTDAEIIITCDRPRNEMFHYADAYREYMRALMIRAEHDWWNVTPVVMERHLHQVEMLRQTMPLIDSEYILYVEHDTPLVGDIDFDLVIDTMRESDLNLMRFYHEVAVHPEHEHLMSGPVMDKRWRPTMQWSQRPHVAKRSFYEERVLRLFENSARCMIEDVMFGVVEGAWLADRQDGWRMWRLGLWHPEGNIQRSTHLDGRGEDPKFDDRFRFDYRDGVKPPGAPATRDPRL